MTGTQQQRVSRGVSRVRARMRGDDGTMSAEMVILIPMLVLFIAVVIGLGRAVNLQGDVEAAAREGARAASLERSFASARVAAQDAVTAALPPDRRADCQAVDLGASDWEAGGQVTVELRCTADMADLSLPGIPGTIDQTSDASAPLDTFRGQS